MCYVRMSKAEMDEQGRMLTCDEWLRIADEGRSKGLLYILLTGGEPLLYPEFKRLYASLAQKGFILTVNTNGTLIDEEWADFFSENGCRRLSITLYGKDDETYGRLCNNPRGFTQVMNAVNLLEKRNIPYRFTSSITPYNVDQMEDFYAIAQKHHVPITVATHMFAGSRRGTSSEAQFRLSPQEEALANWKVNQMENQGVPQEVLAAYMLRKLLDPPIVMRSAFTCRAARSGFWINWKGEITPCGMFNTPNLDLKIHTFQEGWDYIVQEAKKLRAPMLCRRCAKQRICNPCLADNYTETGRTDGHPTRQCILANERIRLLAECAKPEQKE